MFYYSWRMLSTSRVWGSLKCNTYPHRFTLFLPHTRAIDTCMRACILLLAESPPLCCHFLVPLQQAFQPVTTSATSLTGWCGVAMCTQLCRFPVGFSYRFHSLGSIVYTRRLPIVPVEAPCTIEHRLPHAAMRRTLIPAFHQANVHKIPRYGFVRVCGPSGIGCCRCNSLETNSCNHLSPLLQGHAEGRSVCV